MDYEKKYDEALERARQFSEHPLQEDSSNIVEYIFPELQESKDERIRKELIEYIKDQQSSFISAPDCRDKYEEEENNKYNSWIAWLEKQEGCEYIKKDWLEHIKQSWYKEGFIDGKYSGGTSKEWTINDAATLKELIDFLENGTAKLQHDLTKYANWLKIQFTPIEKRGEQKSADKIEPKFHEGDWVVTSYGKVNQVIAVDEDCDGFTLDDDTYFSGSWKDGYHLWTIQDAKDGDVLINWNNTAFIFKAIENETVKFHIAYNEKWEAIKIPSTILSHMGLPEPQFEFHPATKEQCDTLMKAMADAGWEFDFKKKELTKIGQKPVEWKQENIEELTKFENAMMHISGSFFGENAGLDPNDTETIKEQAELLLELAPKQEWSEEDKDFMYDTLSNLTELKDRYGEGYGNVGKCIDWLKILKQRIGG